MICLDDDDILSYLLYVAPWDTDLLKLSEREALKIGGDGYCDQLTASDVEFHVANITEPPAVAKVYDLLLLELIDTAYMHHKSDIPTHRVGISSPFGKYSY